MKMEVLSINSFFFNRMCEVADEKEDLKSEALISWGWAGGQLISQFHTQPIIYEIKCKNTKQWRCAKTYFLYILQQKGNVSYAMKIQWPLLYVAPASTAYYSISSSQSILAWKYFVWSSFLEGVSPLYIGFYLISCYVSWDSRQQS